MKSKKIYLDMVLNLIAAGVPLVVLQVVIYPLAARRMEAETYGLMIAMYSLMLLVNDSLGKALNNVRLINSDEEENKKGNYNLILVGYLLVGILVTVIGTVYYADLKGISSVIAISAIGCFMLANAYLLVHFRIQLNYVAIVINACFMAAGFLIGYLLYRKTGQWVWIFLLGQFASFLYLCIKTPLLREPLKRTDKFKPILCDTSVLAVSLLLSQGMNHVDKLVLFPLLGGAVLSTYYTATLIGKTMSLATGPVNSVILSYLAKRESITREQFRKYVLLCLGICVGLSVVVLLVSRPVLGFLFPKYVDGAMKLVPFTTLNILLYVMAGMVTPVVMRYCRMSWQMIINIICFIVYIGASIALLKLMGTVGFCLGIGLSHLIRFILLIAVFEKKQIRRKGA